MIIADTGFWIALADKKDKHHQQANHFAKTTAERLITTYKRDFHTYRWKNTQPFSNLLSL
jgi:predicted nucleic acid-binding protein